MFCYKCGNELIKNAKYCTSCGTDVKMLIEGGNQTDMTIEQVRQADEILQSQSTPNNNLDGMNRDQGTNALFTFGLILIIIGFVGLVGVAEYYEKSMELRKNWIPALPLFLAALLLVGILLMVIARIHKK